MLSEGFKGRSGEQKKGKLSDESFCNFGDWIRKGGCPRI